MYLNFRVMSKGVVVHEMSHEVLNGRRGASFPAPLKVDGDVVFDSYMIDMRTHYERSKLTLVAQKLRDLADLVEKSTDGKVDVSAITKALGVDK